MTPERWKHIEKLYHEALKLEPSRQAGFLKDACAGDDSLRSEVESLLAYQPQAESFIEVAAQKLAESRGQSLAGCQIGVYQILSLLGVGGMGEVYRAKDSRLGREVAVKVLPSEFSADTERLHRFEQEARVAGSLNHPNILVVYDVGKYGQAPYLVSELLDGETLRDRLSTTALPATKAIDYALQMARGLAAAHQKGIVHRDLKPENLFLTKDSRVKILDFGLAKLTQLPLGIRVDSDVPTHIVTETGVILGTVGYMSPEQARGQAVDHRSDIFSFGAILYEMLYGQRAFKGNSAVEMMNAILKEEPPGLTETNTQIPSALARIVRHCLEKGPEQRFQSVSDIAFDLEAFLEPRGAQTLASVAPAIEQLKWRSQLAWILAAGFLILLVAISLAVAYFREKPLGMNLTQFEIRPPDKTSFAPISFAALSPDGRRLAFVATTSDGKRLVWVRPLDSLDARPLHGTEGALGPFWSPDNRFIGFFAEGKLKKIEVSGGPPLTLCGAGEGYGGAWNRDGSILFSPNILDGLYLVSDTGGVVTPVTSLDPSRRELGHKWPYFLPDGRHFVYRASYAQPGSNGINIGSLDSKDTRRVVSADSSVAYAPPGYLLFVREEKLLAQPFDIKLLATMGGPFPLADRVRSERSFFRAAFTVSESGVLAYESGGNAMNRRLVWLNREGEQLESLGVPGEYQGFELSPDGNRVAVEILGPETRFTDLWILDLKRGSLSKLTFDPAWDNHPVWSPDGNRIVFDSLRELPGNLYTKLSSGDGSDELLLKGNAGGLVPTDWSLDGRFIIYQQSTLKSRGDVWALPLFGDHHPKPLLRSEFDEGQGRLSPDGRWLAYTSNESGRHEVYVQSFPATGDKKQVSTVGGAYPAWRRDGKELFYLAADRKLMAVPVNGKSSFEPGLPGALFEMPGSAVSISICPYAVTANGQHFLINLPAEGANSAPITVVLNWTAILRK